MTAGPRTEPSSDVVAAVATQFGLTPLSVRRAPNGHINDSYFVSTPTGSYVVQRINRAVFADPDAIMRNLLAVQGFLDDPLFPEPVPAPDGRWLVALGSDTWRVLERVPGAASPRSPTTRDVDRAGELLGRFHRGVAGLDPGRLSVTLPAFHDVGRRLEQCRTMMAQDPCDRVSACTGEIDCALGASDLASVAEGLEVRTPRRVVHNDTKIDNFLFRDGDAVSIVDLDTLMPGRWFWDVGDLVRSAATSAAEDETDLDKVRVDPTRYRALVTGYRRGVAGAATEAEIGAVDFAGAISTYEQALRFLTDWLAGDVYFRISRPEQNLDRARAQFRLLAGMPHSPL